MFHLGRLCMGLLVAASLLGHATTSLAAPAQRATLPDGVRRVLVLGDSITHSGRYVALIEAYFITRHPDRKLEFINVGLPSETVSGLSEDGHADGKFPRPDLHERLARVLEKAKPDLVFACYGMNDGIYLPLDDARFDAFKRGMTKLHDDVVKAGAKIVHVTPPVFDEVKGRKPGYAATLARYSEWLLAQRQTGWDVADLHAPMLRELQSRREKDPTFALAGDGVHPGDLGHWIMARQVLLHLGAQDIANTEDATHMLAAHPKGEELFKLIQQRQSIRRDAWLTETRHTRPGMKAGLPMSEAEAKAAEVSGKIEALITGRTDNR